LGDALESTPTQYKEGEQVQSFPANVVPAASYLAGKQVAGWLVIGRSARKHSYSVHRRKTTPVFSRQRGSRRLLPENKQKAVVVFVKGALYA